MESAKVKVSSPRGLERRIPRARVRTARSFCASFLFTKLRRERARTKAPFRILAAKYGVSVFTAHSLGRDIVRVSTTFLAISGKTSGCPRSLWNPSLDSSKRGWSKEQEKLQSTVTSRLFPPAYRGQR